MKGIFCDFYGTIVYENGPKSWEVVERMYKNSNAKSREELLNFWWKSFNNKLMNSVGENFRKQVDISLESFAETVKHFNSSEDPMYLNQLMIEHWSNPKLYEESISFIDKLDLPLYIVTSSDNVFVLKAMENLNIKPQGVYTSEMAKYPKPSKEIFLHALNETGLKPSEVMHIGDSLKGDFETPTSLGITSLWLNRDNLSVPSGVNSVTSLIQALEYIKRL